MEDNFYTYRGYSILEDDTGVFIGDMEFVSADEAEEWVDAQLEDISDQFNSFVNVQEIQYRVFFVSPDDRHSRVDVYAVSPKDAINWVKDVYCPGADILDWDTLDD